MSATKDDVDLVVAPATLAEVLAAIEGYRNQLSTFSDSALAEITMLRRFILVLMDERPPPLVGLVKLPPP